MGIHRYISYFVIYYKKVSDKFNKIEDLTEFFKFTGRLVNVLSSSHADFVCVSKGHSTTRKSRPRYLVREEILQELWTDYENGLTLDDFLERGAAIADEISLRLWLVNEEESDEEEEG